MAIGATVIIPAREGNSTKRSLPIEIKGGILAFHLQSSVRSQHGMLGVAPLDQVALDFHRGLKDDFG